MINKTLYIKQSHCIVRSVEKMQKVNIQNL